MARYIAKRILYMIPVLLGVTLLVFFIMHLGRAPFQKTIIANKKKAAGCDTCRQGFMRYGTAGCSLVPRRSRPLSQ